jgi:hypothetical protein
MQMLTSFFIPIKLWIPFTDHILVGAAGVWLSEFKIHSWAQLFGSGQGK